MKFLVLMKRYAWQSSTIITTRELFLKWRRKKTSVEKIDLQREKNRKWETDRKSTQYVSRKSLPENVHLFKTIPSHAIKIHVYKICIIHMYTLTHQQLISLLYFCLSSWFQSNIKKKKYMITALKSHVYFVYVVYICIYLVLHAISWR